MGGGGVDSLDHSGFGGAGMRVAYVPVFFQPRNPTNAIPASRKRSEGVFRVWSTQLSPSRGWGAHWGGV